MPNFEPPPALKSILKRNALEAMWHNCQNSAVRVVAVIPLGEINRELLRDQIADALYEASLGALGPIASLRAALRHIAESSNCPCGETARRVLNTFR